MLPEEIKTCKLCGHTLWSDEEKQVCVTCKHDFHILAQALYKVQKDHARKLFLSRGVVV